MSEPRCTYCGRFGKDGLDPDSRPWTKDHIIPRARGGTNDPSNIARACFSCNSSKGALPKDVFLQRGNWSQRWDAELAVERRAKEPYQESLVFYMDGAIVWDVPEVDWNPE